MSTVMDVLMKDPQSKKPMMPVRLGAEALEVAKKAASLQGMSLAEYATAVLLEAANRDLDRWSAARAQAVTKKAKKLEGGGA
jgi:hypothetical protein